MHDIHICRIQTHRPMGRYNGLINPQMWDGRVLTIPRSIQILECVLYGRPSDGGLSLAAGKAECVSRSIG